MSKDYTKQVEAVLEKRALEKEKLDAVKRAELVKLIINEAPRALERLQRCEFEGVYEPDIHPAITKNFKYVWELLEHGWDKHGQKPCFWLSSSGEVGYFQPTNSGATPANVLIILTPESGDIFPLKDLSECYEVLQKLGK